MKKKYIILTFILSCIGGFSSMANAQTPIEPECYTKDSMQAAGFKNTVFCDDASLYNYILCLPYALDTVEFEFKSFEPSTYLPTINSTSFFDTLPSTEYDGIYFTEFSADTYAYRIHSLTGNCPDIIDTFILSILTPSVQYPLLPDDTTLCPNDTLHVVLQEDTNGVYKWETLILNDDTTVTNPFDRYFINDTSKLHTAVYPYLLTVQYECEYFQEVIIDTPVDYDVLPNTKDGYFTTTTKLISDTLNIYYAVQPEFNLMGGDSVFICRDSGCTLEVVSPNFLPEKYDFKWEYPSGEKNGGSTFYTTDTGWHYVTISHTQCNLSAKDSAYLEYVPLWLTETNLLPPDTTLCPGDSLRITLQNDSTFNTYYHWEDLTQSNDTLTNPSDRFFINDSFKFHDFVYTYKLNFFYECKLSATPTLHVTQDTLNIYYAGKPEFELINDTVICRDSGYMLEALNINFLPEKYDYEWICPSSNKTEESFYTADSGWYYLTVSIEQCPELSGKDSVYLEYVPLWWTDINLPPDTFLCDKTKMLLDACTGHDGTSYLWLFAADAGTDTASSASADFDTVSTKSAMEITEKNIGAYTIVLTDEKFCRNEQKITITNDPCTPAFEMPNIITPNGDGINDLLKVKTAEYIYDFAIFIYDRWGVLAYKYSGKHEDFSWDGSYMKNGGRAVPDGAYFYVITYKDARGKKNSQAGSVTILR
ncbi:MAG: gliding motility-associated C-terminal domain-containing protein [Bacteroidales bacterium]|nr:gliding motility-associated C-terminal domain-containing protein [Bacteroidales bacterium]